MKPRTKLQVEVWDLHKNLSNPKEQEPYIISKHKYYYTNHYKKLVCLECNHVWKPSQIWQEEVLGVECPSCNKKLQKVSTQNGGMATKIITYSVVQVVNRFQLIRYFSCYKHMCKNKNPKYSFHSLFEEWKDWDKNKTVYVGRTESWSGDGFSNSEYEVRAASCSGYRGNPYDRFTSDYNCPGPVFLSRFKKYGLKNNFHDCDYRVLLSKLESNSEIETLLKAKQKDLLFYAIHKDNRFKVYWAQIKIVLRNKYKIKDVGLWYDYLDLLKQFGKDIRNPKFILPKNLKKEHNEFVIKKEKRLEIERNQRELRRQENERAKAEAEEALKGIKAEVFKNFTFKKGKIQIVTLLDDEDVKLEGKILKHCVYANEYHKKAGILLMSARIEGKRIETIEISLASYSIIQSRGFDNDPTQYHDEIIDIVRKNMNKIQKLVEKQKMLKEVDSKLKKLENAVAA